MNRPTLRLQDLASPQIGAVTGRRLQPDYEAYIEGMAEQLPAIAEAEYQRDYMEEQARLNEQARRENVRQGRIGMGIEATNTLVQAFPKQAAGLAKRAIGMNTAAKGATTALTDTGMSEAVGSMGGGTLAKTGGSLMARGMKAVGSGLVTAAATEGAGWLGEKLDKQWDLPGGRKEWGTAARVGAGFALGGPVGALFGLASSFF